MEKELKPGEDQPLLQPMAVAPLRHTTGAAISSSVLPPRLLIVDIMSASSTTSAAEDDSVAETDRQLLVSVQLTTGGQPRAAGGKVPGTICAGRGILAVLSRRTWQAWNVMDCLQTIGRCAHKQSASPSRDLSHGMSAWCWKRLSCKVRTISAEDMQRQLPWCSAPVHMPCGYRLPQGFHML